MLFVPEFEGNANPNPDKTIVNQRTFWNFYGFTSISLTGASWSGSVVAPLADLSFTSGNIEGNIYVKRWIDGNGESHAVRVREFLSLPGVSHISY